MKNTMRFLLIVALAAMPLTAAASDIEDTRPEDFSDDKAATIEVGGMGVETDGEEAKVAEYLPVEASPTFRGFITSHGDSGSVDFAFDVLASTDMRGDLQFDLGRMVRSHTSYNSFNHRFVHDRMKNLEATSINGKVVRHTDHNPNDVYGFVYDDLQHRTEFQFPLLSALTMALEVRDQNRTGHVQAFTTSHCDNCHVNSRTHAMDERTRDLKFEAKVAFEGGSLVASANHRTLKHQTNSVTHLFDDALHPELQVPVFDNRLQYDSAEGPMMADFWPDAEKTKYRLDLYLNDLGGFAVNAGGVWSDTKNRYTGYRATYQGYMLNAARVIGRKVQVRWRAKAYTLDNDDVFIDTNERLSIAGPHAGQTYFDVYGKDFDHWRYSAMNRDTLSSDLELGYRVSKEAGTFKLRWKYKAVDREYYEVLPGETETTENILGLYWRARPAKGFKVDAHYKVGDISNPYMLINGACSTLVSDRYTNPWQPETPDYDDFHNARVAETSASAEEFQEFKVGATFFFGNATTLSGTYRYWDGDNQAGDLTDWQRTNSMATLTLWSAPDEDWDWYIAYALTDSELDAPVCIPVFDG